MPVPLIYSGGGGGGSGVTGFTRLAYRRRLGRKIGPYYEGTVSTEASGLEAERYVISSSVQSDDVDPAYWDRLYLYVRDGEQAGEQRRLMRGSFDGTLGALYVDTPFDDALAAGTGFEVGVLPAESYQGATGLNVIISEEALESLPIEDFVSVTSVDGQSQYGLDGYAWPIKSISGVYYPRTSTTNEARRSLGMGSWGVIQDASSPVLSFWGGLPFTAGDDFEVSLLRPANTWIKQGSTWGDSSVGLTDDADCALYDVRTVVNVAYPVALEYLTQITTDTKERARIDAMAADGHIGAAYTKFYGRFGAGPRVQRVGATGGRGSRFWDRV